MPHRREIRPQLTVPLFLGWAAAQRLRMAPSWQFFTCPVVVRAMETIDSMAFVVDNDRRNVGLAPRGGDGEHLLETLSKRPGSVGVGELDLFGEKFRFAKPGGRVGLSEDLGEAPLDDRALFFREVIGDVSSFVQLTQRCTTA